MLCKKNHSFIFLSPACFFKSTLLLVFLCGLFSSALQAQQGGMGRVSGMVVDSSGAPIHYATIALFRSSDSAMVTGTICSSAGEYHIGQVHTGKYFIRVSLLGYKKAYSSPFIIDSNHLKIFLPEIRLFPLPEALASIVIRAHKPIIVQKPGMMVINVKNSIIASGNNVLEMLQKLPGVTIDQNGNVSLKGKKGVEILINGRPTHLSASELSVLLKGISADQVSIVQLMDIPPAKYAASGSGGMINIQLKKNLKSGFNGSLEVGYGQDRYDRENGSIQLNYRTDKLNLFGNYSYSRVTNWALWHAELYYYTDDTYKTMERMLDEYHTYWKIPSQSNQFTAGLDYNINQNNTLTFQVQGVLPKGNFHSNKNVILKNAQLEPTSFYHALTSNPYSDRNITYALNYHSVLDTLGNSLSAEVDYSSFKEKASSYYKTQNYDSLKNPTTKIHQWQPLPTDITIESFKLDYAKRYKKQKATLSAGFKMDHVKTENQSHLYNRNLGNWKIDPQYSDHFIYNEQVNAVYLSYERTFKTCSFQVGLRAEQTLSKGDQIQLDSIVKRSYLQLFPTLSLQKKLKKASVSFSYGRRIDRPYYAQLNPFHTFGDPYQYQMGNPYLQPQLSQDFQFSYSYGDWLNASLSYNHTHNLQIVTEKILPGHVAVTGFDNLNMQNYYALSVNISRQPFKWWSVNVFLNGYYKEVKGWYVGEHLNLGKATFQMNISNEFTLPKGFSAELSGSYTSKTVYGVFFIFPRGYVDGGVKKDFGKGRTSLSVSVKDILKSHRLKVYHQSNGTKHYSHEYPFFASGGRRLQINFSWKFGNQKIRVKQHTIATKEEIQRAHK